MRSRGVLLLGVAAMIFTLGYLFVADSNLETKYIDVEELGDEHATQGRQLLSLNKFNLKKMKAHKDFKGRIEELKEKLRQADESGGVPQLKMTEEVRLLTAKTKLREKIDALKAKPTGQEGAQFQLQKSELIAVQLELEEEMRNLAENDQELQGMKADLQDLLDDLELTRENNHQKRPDEDLLIEKTVQDTEKQLAQVEEEIQTTKEQFAMVKEQFIEETALLEKEDKEEEKNLNKMIADMQSNEEQPFVLAHDPEYKTFDSIDATHNSPAQGEQENYQSQQPTLTEQEEEQVQTGPALQQPDSPSLPSSLSSLDSSSSASESSLSSSSLASKSSSSLASKSSSSVASKSSSSSSQSEPLSSSSLTSVSSTSSAESETSSSSSSSSFPSSASLNSESSSSSSPLGLSSSVSESSSSSKEVEVEIEAYNNDKASPASVDEKQTEQTPPTENEHQSHSQSHSQSESESESQSQSQSQSESESQSQSESQSESDVAEQQRLEAEARALAEKEALAREMADRLRAEKEALAARMRSKTVTSGVRSRPPQRPPARAGNAGPDGGLDEFGFRVAGPIANGDEANGQFR